MRKCLTFVMLVFVISFNSFNQETFFNAEITKMDSLQREQERPIIVFFTASWCKYCQAMKNNVFNDSSILKLSKHFYTVEFPEDNQRSFEFNGKKFQFVSTGVDQGYHEFTAHYATNKGNVTYPTTVIIWRNQVVFRVSQFIAREDLESVMDAVAEELK